MMGERPDSDYLSDRYVAEAERPDDLEPRVWHAMRWHCIDGWTYGKIAPLLGLSAGRVQQLVAYGLRIQRVRCLGGKPRPHARLMHWSATEREELYRWQQRMWRWPRPPRRRARIVD